MNNDYLFDELPKKIEQTPSQLRYCFVAKSENYDYDFFISPVKTNNNKA
jgi:hypothetical protein